MGPTHTPNIENLRNQAKSLLRAWRQNDPDARRRIEEYYANTTRIGLQTAQYVLAREYGFSSWSALVDYVPRLGYFDDIATFRIARAFDVSAQQLWSAISSPREIGSWLLPVSFEPKAGACYEFRSQPPISGRLGEYSQQNAIRFDSGEDSFWRFAIDSTNGKPSCMLLTVVDRMTFESVRQFPAGATKIWNPGVTAGWHEILDALEYHLTGRQRPRIDYSRLCKFYDRVLSQLVN